VSLELSSAWCVPCSVFAHWAKFGYGCMGRRLLLASWSILFSQLMDGWQFAVLKSTKRVELIWRCLSGIISFAILLGPQLPIVYGVSTAVALFAFSTFNSNHTCFLNLDRCV
jgi:hypothetical protein